MLKVVKNIYVVLVLIIGLCWIRVKSLFYLNVSKVLGKESVFKFCLVVLFYFVFLDYNLNVL